MLSLVVACVLTPCGSETPDTASEPVGGVVARNTKEERCLLEIVTKATLLLLWLLLLLLLLLLYPAALGGIRRSELSGLAS